MHETGIQPLTSGIFRSVCVRSQRSVVVLIFLFFSFAGCTSLFFSPGKELVNDQEVANHAPEEVNFKSSDGTALTGWYFKSGKGELGTVLVCHGNVENMSTHVKLDLWLVDAGYNLFIFDYRGYGRSRGIPDVKGIHLDAEAALETLLERTQGKVFVFGKSLGGAVAVHMVAGSPHRDRVKALIIESAFSSYRLIAREKIAASVIGWPFQYPLSFLVGDDYSPAAAIRKISPIPVLIMHGPDDTIVPQHHGRILYEAASEPKEYWELTVPGHVRSWTDKATRERLLEYLRRVKDDGLEPPG